MTNRSEDRILVEREFDVDLPVDTVWALLAQVQRWPEWAPHIRRARLDGVGKLGPDSNGEFRFSPVGSGRVHVTDWEPPCRWTWRGRVVGLPIVYHHYFKGLPGATTRLRWAVELAEGRRGHRANAFAWVYGRLIDRAWPRFATWARQEATREAP
jgi:Polyketide cyclase / dehydrase and lipid transport